jgi:hypothetical protein
LTKDWPRGETLAAWLFGLAVLAFTLYVNRAWLIEEHRRMEPWRIACIWLNDATAVFWYLWFGLRYALLGRSPQPRSWELPLVLVTSGLSLAIDLAITFDEMRHEQERFAAARETDGWIVAAEPMELCRGDVKRYTLTARYADAAGATHELTYTMGSSFVPRDLKGQLAAGGFPIPVRMSYDPDWPPRSWITPIGLHSGERLYNLSLIIQIVQALALLGMAGLARDLYRRGDAAAEAGTFVNLYRMWVFAAVLVPLSLVTFCWLVVGLITQVARLLC